MNKFLFTMFSSMLLLTTGAALAQTPPAAQPHPMPVTRAPGGMSSQPAGSAAAPAKSASVQHAQFTTAIDNREPSDDVTSLDNSHTQIFFFTELKDAAGQTITHRWQYNGKVVAQVMLTPKADHWRTWSSKTLMPDQTGTWTVQVVDASGKVLLSKSFDYTKAPAMSPAATHKPPAAPTPAASAATKSLPL